MPRNASCLALLALAFVALPTGDARAQPLVPGSITSVMLGVGGTASFDVGYARGIHCDDIAVVRPELRGETPTSNRFFVTGMRPGRTLCRVGTFRGSPTVFLDVTVVR